MSRQPARQSGRAAGLDPLSTACRPSCSWSAPQAASPSPARWRSAASGDRCRPRGERPAPWRNVYFGPVAASIGASAIVAEFLGAWPAWPVGGFVATTAYLLAVALQLTLQIDWRRLAWIETSAARSSEMLVRSPLRRTTTYVLRREEGPPGEPPLPPDA